ncbi:MAG TPA: nucleotidyltransferase family protein [Verrucomicrobiae bacterium]|jgi:NDP-sugar pyrophosphorylase family protein|nr:nucleotidyltransferase family protein [Verrucomicrobiae bacterium]
MSELSAIILCGGKGERLRPFTDTFPKPLVPLNGKPLLFYLLQHLRAGGVRHFVLCVGHKADAIEDFARRSRSESWQMECVNSGDVSMADRILHARQTVQGRAIICYGDTLANVNLANLQSQHRSSEALATLTVYPFHSPFGIVDMDEAGRVVSVREKPVLPYWINIGYMLCEPQSFEFLSPGTDLPSFAAALGRAGRLNSYRHQGKHVTVNTEKERSEAEVEMLEFFTVLEN